MDTADARSAVTVRSDRSLSDAATGFESSEQSLDAFLASVQGRAVTMARMAVGNPNDALDLVQDAMISFVGHYAGKPDNERRPLFYRVLNNRITDWYRERARRDRWWFRPGTPKDDDAIESAPVAVDSAPGPDGQAEHDQFGQQLEAELARLPLRQRQVFLLRAWEELDVAETARALEISTGSVKTHYFRALARLRVALEA